MEKYFIPHNFKDNGRILGVWEKKHFYLALAWWIPTTLGLFFSPLALPIKVFVEILLVLPPTIVLAMGYADILTHLRDHKKKSGIYERPLQEEEADTTGRGKKKDSAYRYRDIVPVRGISKGIVTLADGSCVRILNVTPVNFKLKSAAERAGIILGFEEFLKSMGISFQICVVTQKAETADFTHRLRDQKKRETKPNIGALIDSYIGLIEQLQEKGAITRKFILSYAYPLGYKQHPGDVSFDAVQRYFIDTDNRILDFLKFCGNELYVQDDNDFQIAQLLNAAMCRNNYDFDPIRETLWGSPVNYTEQITPLRIDTSDAACLQVDDKYIASFVVNWIPYQVEAAWLEDLICFGEGVNLSIFYDYCDPVKVRRELNMAIGNTTVKRKKAGENQSDLDIIENNLEHARYIRGKMSENQPLYYVTIVVSVCAGSPESLKRMMDDVEAKILSKGMLCKRTDFLQSRAYLSSLPLARPDKILREQGERNMLSGGAASSYPFSSFEFSDRNGVMFGVNEHNRSLVSVDIFNSALHSNANMVIFGGSGSGKTYTMQTILSRLRMQGIPVTIIAPLKAHENRRLCSALDGEYIKFSPSSKNTINMLEIRVPRQVTDESLMLMKVARLHAPFSLMFGEGREGGMTMVEKQYLDDKLIELYEGFGITADNKWTRRKERKMPLLGHLYDALKDDPNTQRLAVMLKPYVFGSMRIFNEHTNVDLSNQYVVMDVCELTSDDAITLYMLQCLEIFTDFLKEDITQRKAIAIDEIWRLIGVGGNGGGNRIIAAWVLELVKTIRGLGGSIISATQDVEDCFSLDGGIYGKALINNSRIKMLMGMEEHEAEIIKGVMNLSEEEKARLTSFPRGHGLFYSGRNHIAIHVRASEAEHRFITTDRAELERMKEAGVAV